MYIVYNRFFTTGWFISGFCRLLSGWPAGSAAKRVYKPLLAYVIFFLLHFTFNLMTVLNNDSFFRGSVRVSRVRV